MPYCNQIMSHAVTVVLRGSVPGREVRPGDDLVNEASLFI